MNTPPLVCYLQELVPYGERPKIARRAGIATVTMSNWFAGKTDPRLSLFEASLNAVGYRLEIVPMENDV